MLSITNKEQIPALLKASESFTNLKITLSGSLKENLDELILSDLWPREVPASLIIETPHQARLRACSIVSFYNMQSFKGKKFLDFGCGQGDCVAEATAVGVKAFGFDIKEQWQSCCDQGVFTTDIQEINANGPYDLIAFYDVIDHTENHEKALEALRRAAMVCSPETIIRVRCHPWTSRHGGHLYESVNRAYAHILLSQSVYEECKTQKMWQVKRPLSTYQQLFSEAGLKVVSMDKTITPLEPIFQSAQFVEQFRQKLGCDKKWQQSVLPVAFVDYRLKKC